MQDFFDCTEENLNVPNTLQFEPGNAVEFTILADIKQNNDKGYLCVPCRVNTGEHKNKVHLLFIRKADKRGYSSFMQAFWKREDILEKKAKPSSLIGKSFRAVPSPLKEYQGKMYQSLENFLDMGIMDITNADPKPTATDLPF